MCTTCGSEGSITEIGEGKFSDCSVCGENPRDCWMTPPWLCSQLGKMMGVTFTLDAFASNYNALCMRYNSIKDDTPREWHEPTFANPPYTREGFAEMLRQAKKAAAPFACVVPPRVRSPWFREMVEGGCSVWVPTKRVAFVPPPGVKSSSPRYDTVVLVSGIESPTMMWFEGAEV